MKHRYPIAASLVLAAAGIALAAGSFSETYEGLVSAPSEMLTNHGGDAAALTVSTTPTAGRSIATSGNPTAYVRVDFSGSAGDTLVVYCLLWHKKGSTWTFLGAQQSTVTAGAVLSATDNVGTNLAMFDTASATHVEIRTGAPSAGTVDITAWVGASNPGS